MRRWILILGLVSLTARAAILPVPLFRQSTDYSCGAASLQAVLYYWGVYDGTEQALFPLLKVDPEWGTDPQGIIDGAHYYGLQAELKTGFRFSDLAAALKKKQTVIVAFQAWAGSTPASWVKVWKEGHYAVVVELDEKYITFMDPVLGGRYGQLERSEFEERWHDIDRQNQQLYQPAIVITGKEPADRFPLPVAPIE